MIARCRRKPRLHVDEGLHAGFYFIRFDSETEWGRALEHRCVRIANTGLTYGKDSIFMFVHVRSSGFHLDGFGRSSHELKPSEDEEVELHFSELRSSQLSPLQLWERAASEKAHGLAMNYGSAFTEGRCRKLCDGLFRDKSGLKVTEQYVGWVGLMFNAATVIYPEKPLPNPDPNSPAHSFPVKIQIDAPHSAAPTSSRTAAQKTSADTMLYPDGTMLYPAWPPNTVIDKSLIRF